MKSTSYFSHGEIKVNNEPEKEKVFSVSCELKASFKDINLYKNNLFEQYLVCKGDEIIGVGNLGKLKKDYPELISTWEHIVYKSVMGI